MPINSAFDPDKTIDMSTESSRRKGEMSQNGTNGNGSHNIQLDTYFAEEKVAIPERVGSSTILSKCLLLKKF